MKVLHLIKSDPDETLKTVLAVQGEQNDITVQDLREQKDYRKLIELIDQSDRVISW